MAVKLIKEAYNGLTTAPLRPFTKTDYYGYAGATKINGEDEPLIYSGEYLELTVSGYEGKYNGKANLEVYAGDDVTYVAYQLPIRKAIILGKKIALMDGSAKSLDEVFEFLDGVVELKEY